MLKTLSKYAVAFLELLLIFNVLLLLASLFPSSWIQKHVAESADTLLEEGNLYPLIEDENVVNNNYTDSIMINMSYSIDHSEPIFSYMSGRKNYRKGLTTTSIEDVNGEAVSFNTTPSEEIYDPGLELHDFVLGNVTTSQEYARYWHGFLVFLRPLLLVFNITQIRHLLLFVFILLLVALFILISKKLNIAIAFIYSASLLIYHYFHVSYSLESAPIFITMMLSCIFLLIYIEKIKNIYLYLFIVGCISNFVDFLTVPLISLAMPLYLYILYQQKNNQLDLKASLKLVLLSCLSWGVGYRNDLAIQMDSI